MERNCHRLSTSDPGPATIHRTQRKGEDGTWVILWSGHVSNSYGLLKKGRLNEVIAGLEELNKPAWSDEVNGLKISASEDHLPGWRDNLPQRPFL
jgi:hypothetical protein